MDFFHFLRENIVLFDGAMGTEIQKLEINEHEWGGYSGCNEMLTISAPHLIAKVYRDYLNAGADVIETNTFGANRIVLAEYELEDRTVEINREAAKLAVQERDSLRREQLHSTPRYVAGSMGPGTKLPSLGQVDFDTIHFSYLSQARGLIEGGVEVFIIETAQDLLQIKSAVLAVQDAMKEAGVLLPLIVSVTVETNGNLLVGSDIPAAVTALAPLGVDVIGINCATGPVEMRPHIHELSRSVAGPIFCMPNAGFPEQRNGKLVYDLGPEDYADILTSFVSEFGVDIIGGCCGTGPGYIAELRKRIPSLKKARRKEKNFTPLSRAALSSLYSRQELHQEPAPFFVGERTNTNGSKKFRTHLLQDDWNTLVLMGKQQQKTGAHGLDICVAYAGRDETRDMGELVGQMTTAVDLPLVIDSTEPDVVETALKLTGGRALINSTNLENGEEAAGRLFQLARRYGAAIICLTIDETGMARDIEKKIEVARRIAELATKRYGLSPEDLVIDPLTFTLGSGDTSLQTAGADTLAAIRRLETELPGIHTVLGISNISFGLSPQSREVLNSVFLAEAVKAGLDLAIVNVKKIIPVFKIPKKERQLALDLIYHHGKGDPLLSFINYFSSPGNGSSRGEKEREYSADPKEKLRELVKEGTRAELEETLDSILKEMKATAIINELLIPAMKTVGDLFGEGKIQLPFVLQSAEVMKKAVEILETHLEKHEAGPGKSIVLATVRGDVHDIGKNLVDIILSNNGYRVFNLGIKVDIETIMEKAREVDADAIGMSGLLVKSTSLMKSNLEEMHSRGMKVPVLLGGAALTERFVRDECAPISDGPVYFCRDAFDGLKAMEEISGKSAQADKLPDTRHTTPPPDSAKSDDPREKEYKPSNKSTGKGRITLKPEYIPTIDSYELHRLEDIDIEELCDFVNQDRLFRSRWRYRRGASSEMDYKKTAKDKILPIYLDLKHRLIKENLVIPRAAYRILPCIARDDEVVLFNPESGREIGGFVFPRQKKPPFRSVADFFIPERSHDNPGEDRKETDVIALQIVTLGPQIIGEIQRLFAENSYRDYLHLHGLAVELTEALAEYTQTRMEREHGIHRTDGDTLVPTKHRGTRYSFGYPCCPDLSANRRIGKMLKAEQLGIDFTEDDQMVPEFSTSGFISFHPEAEYFSL